MLFCLPIQSDLLYPAISILFYFTLFSLLIKLVLNFPASVQLFDKPFLYFTLLNSPPSLFAPSYVFLSFQSFYVCISLYAPSLLFCVMLCFCMFGNNFILKNYTDQLPMYHVSNYQLLSFSCKKSKKSERISENHLQRDFFGMHVGLNSCANIG